ncbi:HAMP domain-containing sensor histidine kinase [Jeotgalibacillus aurantiacus]|uniref:HAMP domain-containing sensor histidine kinase n=1 Tax=Jeotgalibacillus aurantiacus TaxID=2763266 RepID=UPI001D0B4C81|nr:HAMP domain-containing sensor histidine kinase [Jeotgalibacillus aurantiacus]
MDTKLRDKLAMIFWLLLLSYGTGGLFNAWSSLWSIPYFSAFSWIFTGGAAMALAIVFIWFNNAKLTRQLSPEKWQPFYDRIPLDAALIIVLISWGVCLDHFRSSNILDINYVNTYSSSFIYYFVHGTIAFSFSLFQSVFLYRRLKAFSNWQHDVKASLSYRLWKIVSEAFVRRHLAWQLLFLALSVGASGVFVVGVLIEAQFFIFLLPLFILSCLLMLFMFKRIGYLNQIVTASEQAAQGNLQQNLPVKGKSIFAELAQNINTMKDGVHVSRQEQAKSERLKTELITNVSHDLRTPLTSIMTYTQLLKDQQLPQEEQRKYVDIIDQKSKRLKMLIEDLFEVSKMASGSVELIKSRIDINQLLEQALGEHDDAVQQSSIQIRVSKPNTPVMAFVDGQKLWRVFDNLIGNILKYSMDHTRAYIQLEEDHHQIKLTFKNISKFELSDNLDELFERFKRGDESRHTEGSGLGLAISKSIIDLHEGRMDLTVDGDLFKVTILLKK